MRKSLVLIVVCFSLVPSFKLFAQFSFGIEGGVNKNYLHPGTTTQAFSSYHSATGISFGIPVLYQVNDWFGVQSGINYTQKNYELNRSGFFQGIYQNTTNAYLQIPVMANFSFGGDYLRGFVNLGAYAGYWVSSKVKGTEANILNTVDTAYKTVNPTTILGENNGYNYNEKYQFDNTKDNRIEFGYIAAAGISYQINDTYKIFAEARYNGSFTDQQKKYQTNQVARYNDTYGIAAGVFFTLNSKKLPGYLR